jgi:hypothetical protein
LLLLAIQGGTVRKTLGAFLIIVGLSVSASAQSVFHVDFTDLP